MTVRLLDVNTINDILPSYCNTPIGALLEYHNLNKPFCRYDKAQILIGMCMDNRTGLWIPPNFAFIIRSGGANLMYSEFQVSFAISMAGIRHMAIIAHSDCRMVDLKTNKRQFVKGMVDHAGWKAENAEHHFDQLSLFYEIGNELEFIVAEAKRLQKRYPKVQIAPLYYKVEDGKLYQLEY